MLLYSKMRLRRGAAQAVLGPSSPSSRWHAAVVLAIQALAARFDARYVRIWKGQRMNIDCKAMEAEQRLSRGQRKGPIPRLAIPYSTVGFNFFWNPFEWA